MSFVTQVLGLEDIEAKMFDQAIDKLEDKIAPQRGSIISQITANLHQSSAAILKKLGFEGNNVTGEEAYRALANLASSSMDGWADSYDSRLIITDDGVISANREDIKLMTKEELDFSQRPFHGFREKLIDEITEEYSKSLKFTDKEQIKQQLKGD